MLTKHRREFIIVDKALVLIMMGDVPEFASVTLSILNNYSLLPLIAFVRLLHSNLTLDLQHTSSFLFQAVMFEKARERISEINQAPTHKWNNISSDVSSAKIFVFLRVLRLQNH